MNDSTAVKWAAGGASEGGELIWVAGHSAPGQSAGEQIAGALESLGRTLHEAGASWPDVRSARAYLQSPDDETILQESLSKYFGASRPALTVLFGGLRPGALFLIECVAVRPEPNQHVGA